MKNEKLVILSILSVLWFRFILWLTIYRFFLLDNFISNILFMIRLVSFFRTLIYLKIFWKYNYLHQRNYWMNFDTKTYSNIPDSKLIKI